MNNTHYPQWALVLSALLISVNLLGQPCAAVNSDLGSEPFNNTFEEGSEDAQLPLFPLLGNSFTLSNRTRGQLRTGQAVTSAFEYRQRTDGSCLAISSRSPYPIAIIKFIPTRSATLNFASSQADRNNISFSLFRGSFDPTIDNCSQLQMSSFRTDGIGGFSNREFFQAPVVGGENYFLVILPGQSDSAPYPRNYNIFVQQDEDNLSPSVYDGSVISDPTYAFTFLAVRSNTDDGQTTNEVSGISSSGNFSALEAGAYTIYGLNYDTAIDTTTFFNAELEDLLVDENGQDRCLQLSSSTAFVNVTSATVAPVDWLTFTATPAGTAIKLNWDVAAETENDYFRIERSTDGIAWTDIGEVAGNGTTKEYAAFTFTDRSPAPGANYYRLVQIDFDGTENLSVVVQASGPTAEVEPINAFPNPFSSELTLTTSTDKIVELPRVYDIQGREVSDRVVIERSGRQATITTAGLATGMYIIRWGNEQTRVIKR